MQTYTINFSSIINEINATETLVNKPNSYQNYLADNLSGEIASRFESIIKKLTGKDFNPSWNVVSLYFDENGILSKCFPLSVQKSEGKLVCHLGSEVLPLDTAHKDLNFTVNEFKFDRYNEVVLSVYDDEADTLLPLPLRLSDEAFKTMLVTAPDGSKSMNFIKLATAVSKSKWDVLLSHLKEAKKNSSTPISDFRDEATAGELYLVTALKEVKVNYNGRPAISYIVTLNIQTKETSFWLPSNLRQSAELGRIVSGQTYLGYFASKPNDKGVVRISGIISQTGIQKTLVAKPEIQALPAEATITVEASEVLNSTIPFKGRVEGLEWAKRQAPQLSEDHIATMMTELTKTEFYEAIMDESVVPF